MLRRMDRADALRVLPLLHRPVDCLLVDAKEDDYLVDLRAVEPRRVRSAPIVADNTGIFRRAVEPHLDRVRTPPWPSRECEVDGDCVKASVVHGPPR
jgi:hypothetical protein